MEKPSEKSNVTRWKAPPKPINGCINGKINYKSG
jgi:hypothetical protein